MAAAATTTFHDTWRPRANPWVIAITVTLATFMEALDTSIANVAMPHIGGSLSASPDEATWVLTSYLVANAMVLPISGWIANRIGRKRFYMSCVFLFTIASLLCGLAPRLPMLVFFRVLQGAAGGGLQPSEQSILADTFPPAKAQHGLRRLRHGRRHWRPSSAPPSAAGSSTTTAGAGSSSSTSPSASSRSTSPTASSKIRPISPKSASAAKASTTGASACSSSPSAPSRSCSTRARKTTGSAPASSSPASSSAIIGLALFIWRQLTIEHPILDLRLFARRNVGMTQLVMFMVGVSLYSSTVLIPQFLQEIMGYSARQAGMAVSSGGLVLMFLFPVAGALAPKFDPRKLVAIGFVITTFGLYRMTDHQSRTSASAWPSAGASSSRSDCRSSSSPSTRSATPAFPRRNTTRSAASPRSCAISAAASASASSPRCSPASARSISPCSMPNTAAGNPALSTRCATASPAPGCSAAQPCPTPCYHAGAQIYGMAQIQARLLAYVDVIWIMVAVTTFLIPLPFLMNRPKKLAPAPMGH